MTFYTLSYFERQQQVNSLFNYAIIIILLLLIIFNLFRYYRQHLRTRNRDLVIIFLLLLLIFTGIQVTNLETGAKRQSATIQMQPFIKSVALDHNLKPNQVMVNSKTLQDGIIVRFKKKDYRVNMSPSGDNYTLTRAHVVDHRVIVQN
ncbi:DUF3290 family protein [Lactobacillaceae bacterium 24-114]